jgi:hypothetical protein
VEFAQATATPLAKSNSKLLEASYLKKDWAGRTMWSATKIIGSGLW